MVKYDKNSFAEVRKLRLFLRVVDLKSKASESFYVFSEGGKKYRHEFV